MVRVFIGLITLSAFCSNKEGYMLKKYTLAAVAAFLVGISTTSNAYCSGQSYPNGIYPDGTQPYIDVRTMIDSIRSRIKTVDEYNKLRFGYIRNIESIGSILHQRDLPIDVMKERINELQCLVLDPWPTEDIERLSTLKFSYGVCKKVFKRPNPKTWDPHHVDIGSFEMADMDEKSTASYNAHLVLEFQDTLPPIEKIYKKTSFVRKLFTSLQSELLKTDDLLSMDYLCNGAEILVQKYAF